MKSLSARAGLAVLALLFVAALAAPFATPYGAEGRGTKSPAQLLSERHLPPSGSHPLGTDAHGRDLLARTLHGARVSLAMGILARALAVLLGGMVGICAGTLGGSTDRILSRVLEIFLAFPGLLLAMAIGVALGASFATILVAIVLVSWCDVAVILRAASADLVRRPFVTAARAQGASEVRIVVLHLLPHLAGPAAVLFTFGIASAIMIESSLSFLGLAGGGGEYPTWGRMIFSEEPYLAIAPWGVFAPGFFLAATVLGWNLVGDELRDRLDVRR